MSTAIKPPPTLEADECDKLLVALLDCENTPIKNQQAIRNHCMALLMLDAGLRVGEVVALKISHLYFNYRPVETLLLTPSITKNHKERSIPVTTRLSIAISQYRNACLPPGLILNESFCFYVTDQLIPLTTRQVENIITTASMKCWGRRINPHMLRHTFASRLLRITNMRTVQELLGHSCITSTQIYTHPNEDDKKKAIETIDNAAHDYMTERFGPSS
ncbi:Tyrosine recombinase XerC [subsurface metagenome]